MKRDEFMKFLVLIFAAILLAGCNETEFKESKTFAGGKVVSSATLNLGKTTYMEYCVQCHGVKGEGNGPSSKGLLPPPRNLTQGLYKFPWVAYGELPHDEDFYRIIKGGLKGSAMLPWDIHQTRLEAVTQYIKTFAPGTWEGGDKTLGVKVEATPDPYGEGKKNEAIERGKKVYHVVAQCTTCHRAYVTKAELSEINKEINKEKLTTFEADLYQLKPQDSEYNYKALPPDFTYHELRSIRPESSLNDIYQRLIYGVTGSGMPGWKGVISDDDLWAAAYYIDDLRALKKNPSARQALLDKLDNQ